MGLSISMTDVQSLLGDEKLMDEMVKQVLDDPDAMDNLAGSIANELSGIIEDDPRLTSKLLGAAMKDSSLKKRIIKKLVDDLG